MIEDKPSLTIVDWLFRLLGILSVILLVLLLYDLFALGREPFNPSISEFPIRVLLGIVAGSFGVAISNLILWRVPGNPVGRLLLLWSAGGISWQFSYNFGSVELDQFAFFAFALYFGTFATTSVVLLLFYFPTGKVFPEAFKRFIPAFVVVKFIGTILAVASLNPSQYNHAVNPFQIAGLVEYSSVLSATVGINGGAVSIIGLALGTVTLIVRYRQSEMIEQQQIKWLAWAGSIMAIMALIFMGIHLLVFEGFATVVPVLDYPFFIMASSLPTLAVGAAVFRYRLWDVNFLISRTVLYVALTAILAAVFAASATIINQLATGLFEAESGAPAALVSTILIVSIFQPLRKEIESWINERYFPENRELSRDFLEFSGEYRSLITKTAMLHLITQRICSLLNARWGCIFLNHRSDEFSPSSAWNMKLEEIPDQSLKPGMMTRWGAAKAVRSSKEGFFKAFIPLYVPRIREDDIVGVLALGPRHRGQGYSRNDLRELTRFGEDAGKVLYSYELRGKNRSK